MQVLWFASTKSMEEDNFYGNVSFVIKWKDVLHQFGPNIYLIDQAIYKRNSFTRILLTPKRYYQLTLMSGKELADNGACMTKNLNNCYQHVSKCYCKDSFGPHELQIGIEVSDDDARWLFRNCSALPNSHTLVNVRSYSNNNRGGVKKMYESYRCYRYNTALNMSCPYPFNLQKTEGKINELNLRGIQNGQSENSDPESNTQLLPSQIMFNTVLHSHDTEKRTKTDNRFNTEPTERRTVENYNEISTYHRTSVRNELSMYDFSSNNTPLAGCSYSRYFGSASPTLHPPVLQPPPCPARPPMTNEGALRRHLQVTVLEREPHSPFHSPMHHTFMPHQTSSQPAQPLAPLIPFNLQKTERKINELNLRGIQNGQSENSDLESNTQLLPSQIMFNTVLHSHDTENRTKTDNRFNTEPTERRTVENYSEISTYHGTSVRNELSMYDFSSNNTPLAGCSYSRYFGSASPTLHPPVLQPPPCPARPPMTNEGALRRHLQVTVLEREPHSPFHSPMHHTFMPHQTSSQPAQPLAPLIPFNLQKTERKINKLNLRGIQNGQSENSDPERNTQLLPSQIMFNTVLHSHDTENRTKTDNRFNTEPTERRTVENYSEISTYHGTSVRNELSMYDFSSNNTPLAGCSYSRYFGSASPTLHPPVLQPPPCPARPPMTNEGALRRHLQVTVLEREPHSPFHSPMHHTFMPHQTSSRPAQPLAPLIPTPSESRNTSHLILRFRSPFAALHLLFSTHFTTFLGLWYDNSFIRLHLILLIIRCLSFCLTTNPSNSYHLPYIILNQVPLPACLTRLFAYGLRRMRNPSNSYHLPYIILNQVPLPACLTRLFAYGLRRMRIVFLPGPFGSAPGRPRPSSRPAGTRLPT